MVDSKIKQNRVNLFIIGVNKAGSSWLYYLLDKHPDIYMSQIKELYYFGNKYPTRMNEYHKHFPFEKEYLYFGEATPTYYRKRKIAQQIYEYSPDAKVAAIVRDPILRALSQFYYHKQIGVLDEEDTLIEAISGKDPALIRDSRYERTLPAFKSQFGKEQFKIVSLERAKTEMEKVWKNLSEFLDIQQVPLPEQYNKAENATGGKWFRFIYRNTIRPVKLKSPELYNYLLRISLLRWTKQLLLKLFGTAKKSPPSSRMLDVLYEKFEPTYEYLNELGFQEYYPSSINTSKLKQSS